jgi:hypothetical protein
LDLWDGSIDVSLSHSETGAPLPQSFMWTGTSDDGQPLFPLGSDPLPTVGDTSVTDGWVATNRKDPLTVFLFSAVSAPLQVPEPGTIVLASFAATENA